MNQNPNQIKYRLIKAVNFIINKWSHRWKKNGIEMYSTHDEGKSVISERLIRTLKNKIYKYMPSISKKCLYW